MKPSLVAKSLELLIRTKRPAYVLGSPGGGKSAVVNQVGVKLGLPCLDVRAVLYDPVDFRGLPGVVNGFTEWSTPGFLPRAGSGILFLDELPAAPAAVQAALYRLILDRELDGYRLPDGWSIVAAGNKATDGAVTNRVSTALKSRLVTIKYETDFDDWRRHAVTAGIDPTVIGFLTFRPVLLDAFAPGLDRVKDRPEDPRKVDSFPVPRTWEFVSDMVKAAPSPDIEHDLYAGAVGTAAAAEFVGFLKVYRCLPAIDAILLLPDQAPVPTDPATVFALANALSRRASDANFGAIVTYANRMKPEASVALVKQTIDRLPGLQNTRPFIEWSAAHSDVMV
jgi:hypothetical protein